MSTLSKGAIDRLGARLAAAAIPSDDDLVELARAQAQWIPALDVALAVATSAAAGLHIVHRRKTAATLIDKLRRGTKLSSMQDVVGIRIVGPFELDIQDAVVARLTSALPGSTVKDRRGDERMHGYRAVHVMPRIGGYAVEIQVRTLLQHAWANTNESIADRWGRGIRYGEPPLGSDAEEVAYRARQVALLEDLATAIAGLENAMRSRREPTFTRAATAYNRSLDALGSELQTVVQDGFREAFALLRSPPP